MKLKIRLKLILMQEAQFRKRKPGNPAGRPADLPDSVQMRKVARMYYLEKATRQTISDRLNLDPRKVKWLLEQARQLGVVRIDIREPEDEELAARIERKFPHLERVLIASGPEITGKSTPEQWRDFYRRFGILAADYFEELVANHPRGQRFRIGVTGGYHLLAFANAVPQRVRDSVYVHVAALVGRGRLEQSASHIEPSVVASILWSHCGTLAGHCEYATVSPYDPVLRDKKPGLTIIKQELAKLTDNHTIREVIDGMEDLDVVFGGIGVGNPKNAPPELEGRLTMTTLLQRIITAQDLEGAAGDFAYCPYDENGENRSNWRLFMTAGHYKDYWGIDFYKRMVATPGKKVLAFSTGPWMLAMTKIALTAKIINVLVIDQVSAEKIAQGN